MCVLPSQHDMSCSYCVLALQVCWPSTEDCWLLSSAPSLPMVFSLLPTSTPDSCYCPLPLTHNSTGIKTIPYHCIISDHHSISPCRLKTRSNSIYLELLGHDLP